MIDPRGMTAFDWCNQMVQNLASLMNAPKLLRDEDWKDWARAVIANPAISGFQPPNPMQFENWQDWAERFIQVVSL